MKMCNCPCHNTDKGKQGGGGAGGGRDHPPAGDPAFEERPPIRWKERPIKTGLSDDDATRLRDPTDAEIRDWRPPTDMDLKTFKEILDRIRNLTWEQKNRLLIRAVKSKILDKIVPPTKSPRLSTSRRPETQYAGRLRVPESHLWDPMKSIGQYGAYHPDTQFGATRYRHPVRMAMDTELSGAFSIFWDVSGSNSASNDRYGSSGRLFSGMETIVTIVAEARLRGDLVSLYVTPNMNSEGRVIEPIKICGKTAYCGFSAAQYFFKSNDYDAIESCVYGTDTRGYEDYKGTVPFMVRDFYIGETVKRGLSIFIADAGMLPPIAEAAPWLKELYKVSEILYLHITDLSEAEWHSEEKKLEVEKAVFGTSGREYFEKIQPGIVYVNAGDGNHLGELALDELEKRLGGSALKDAGGGVVRHSPRYAKRYGQTQTL